jgi:hypothetical protein
MVSIKKYKTPLLIGGALIGGAFLVSMMFRTKVLGEAKTLENDVEQFVSPRHHPMHTARANLGYVSRANPGIDDLDNNVNQVPGAAGANAGLDPSEYSYLTQRNRNPLLSNLGYAGHMLTGGPARNFEQIRFQGSWGFVGPPGQGFNTYF